MCLEGVAVTYVICEWVEGGMTVGSQQQPSRLYCRDQWERTTREGGNRREAGMGREPKGGSTTGSNFPANHILVNRKDN